MKMITALLLLLISACAMAQVQTIGSKTNTIKAIGRLDADSGTYSKGIPVATKIDTVTFATPYYVNSHSTPVDSVGGQNVTALPYVGESIPKGSPSDVIRSMYFPSQAPTAAISLTYNGTTSTEFDLEYMPVGAKLQFQVNWSAGRLATTAALASVLVDGNNEPFTQPSQGGTTSGSYNDSLTRNEAYSFENAVTTTDGKNANAFASFNFHYIKWWGYCNTTSPTDADILAMAGGSDAWWDDGKSQSFTITIPGSAHLYYAYPSELGALSSFKIGGFESLAGFTLTTRNVTTTTGNIVSYNIYVSNNSVGSSDCIVQ